MKSRRGTSWEEGGLQKWEGDGKGNGVHTALHACRKLSKLNLKKSIDYQ